MGDRLSATVRGFGVLDRLWLPSRIHEADTSITEADPHPGTASTTSTHARLIPQVVGVQSESAMVAVTQSGNPGLGQPRSLLCESSSHLDAPLGDIRKAEVGYYLEDEAVDNLRGLRPATVITDWRTPGTINTPDRADAATFPLSGKVALMWNAASNIRYACWNPYTEAFEHFGNMPTRIENAGAGALVVVPGTERLLYLGQLTSGFSDDYGDTWDEYSPRGTASVRPESGTTYTGKVRAAFDGAHNVAWYATNTNNGNLHAFASSDLGVTWTAVESWTDDPTDWDLAAHPSGDLFLVYIDAADHVKVSRLTGAYAKPSEASPVSAFGDAHSASEFEASRVWLGIDWNGAMYVYAEEKANPGRWRVAVSTDNGTKWNEQLHEIAGRTPYFWNLSDAVEGPGGWRLVPNAAGGLIAAACFGVVGTGREQGGMAKLGGWMSPQSTTIVYGHLDGNKTDCHWVGYAKPENITATSWTFGGTATTTHSSADGSPISPLGYVKIDSGAGAVAGHYTGTLTLEGAWNTVGEFAVQVEEDAGSSDVIGVRWILDSVGDDHSAAVAIYFTETGFRLRDASGSVWFGAQVDFDMTERVWFSVIVSPASNTVDILYRHDGDVKWNQVTYTATTFADLTTSTDEASVRWGHLTSGATDAVSRWWVQQHTAVFPGGITPPESDDMHLSGLDVRGVSVGSEHGYPLPELGDVSAERMAVLLHRGGVGVRGDSYSHDVAPGYPREATFPTIEPSPSRTWRSTAIGVAQSLTIDRGYDGRPSGDPSLLWLVAGANARQWEVSYKEDGGSGYTVVGTVDLATGFTSVGFSRFGNVVTPDSGGNGSRYLWDGELAGGHIILDIGGTPVTIRIRTNKAGFWNSASTPQAVLILEDGFNASTAPSSGLATIVWPTGVMAIHQTVSSSNYRRYWKVTCLSTNKSPDSYYEAGIIAPFGLRAPGKRWGNGWEWSHEVNVQSSEDSYGTERRDERGPLKRILTLGWDHGTKLSRVRGQTDADYVGASGGAPLTARDDVWRNLVGTWQEADSGAQPVVALMTDPGHGVTLTDPTLFLYAYLDGAFRAQHATGAENVAEFMRAGPVRLKEIV